MHSKYIKLSQSKLREKYHCYGHFYKLIVNQKSIPCRSVLEIVEANGILDNEKCPIYHIPDTIVIMMNPGGSEPCLNKTSNYTEHQIYEETFNINFTTKRLVRAIPDTTQNRIMNIMNIMEWKHARIINLSDVRERNSNYLNSHIRKFNSASDSSIHSIFSLRREQEFQLAMTGTGEITPIIIFAWGMNRSLEIIAKHAFEIIKSNDGLKYVGIKQDEQEKYKFYHPSRRKNWQDDILEQIFSL